MLWHELHVKSPKCCAREISRTSSEHNRKLTCRCNDSQGRFTKTDHHRAVQEPEKFDIAIRRFVVAERRSVEFLFEAFNLCNRLNYSSVNNTVGAAIPSSLYGRDDRTPSQPLGLA